MVVKPFLVFLSFALLIGHGNALAQAKRIAAGYSAISATQTGFYVAKDEKSSTNTA